MASSLAKVGAQEASEVVAKAVEGKVVAPRATEEAANADDAKAVAEAP